MNEFRAFLLSLGLVPGTVEPDGRWRRCPTESHPKRKNGSYKLATDGMVGWGMDFAQHSQPVTWRPDRDTAPAVRFDPAALERANAEARRKLVQATHEAREFYAGCAPLEGGHPYLESHGLGMAGCFGLKIDRNGWMVVPALKDRNLMSVQRISPEGDKRFWPGASVKGASYTINRPNASLTVVCEGLATGLAIFAAVPICRVVVAFNAGNLSQVAIPFGGLLTYAADNDQGTEARTGTNPGIVAATEAALKHGGGVAVPQGIEGTDWCDLRSERLAAREVRISLGERRADARRAVDAEIADAMMRNARFRPVERMAAHG